MKLHFVMGNIEVNWRDPLGSKHIGFLPFYSFLKRPAKPLKIYGTAW